MILAATLLLPFAMLGMVFTLAWIETRYLSVSSVSDVKPRTAADGSPTVAGVGGAAPLLRGERRMLVRRPGRHRAPARFFAGHAPPGRRMNPRRA
jgi:hypothetical protein